MYSNLTLYYLNQMGINPWIYKENSLTLHEADSLATSDLSDSSESTPLKLVIILSSELNSKAQLLFKRMIDYINIDDNELLTITMEQNGLPDNAHQQWASQLDNKKPLAVLSLGPKANQFLTDDNISYPVLQSMPLEYLLNNPSYKKKIFQDLHYIKNLITG